VTGRRGRRRRKLLGDIKERRGYSHLDEDALVESGLQSVLNQCTVLPLTESEIPDAVKYNLDLLKMSILLLETCRGI
jgi:hypothetical protein